MRPRPALTHKLVLGGLTFRDTINDSVQDSTVTSGFYRVAGTDQSSAATDHGVLLVLAYFPTHVWQVKFGVNARQIVCRNLYTGEWSAWRGIAYTN